jgi:hypothetical protein
MFDHCTTGLCSDNFNNFVVITLAQNCGSVTSSVIKPSRIVATFRLIIHSGLMKDSMLNPTNSVPRASSLSTHYTLVPYQNRARHSDSKKTERNSQSTTFSQHWKAHFNIQSFKHKSNTDKTPPSQSALRHAKRYGDKPADTKITTTQNHYGKLSFFETHFVSS